MKQYNGHYRGLVVYNEDVYTAKSKPMEGKPLSFGRCKIFIDGIYPPDFKNSPLSLPWAEPVFPLFGGNSLTKTQKDYDKQAGKGGSKNFTNPVTGWISIPHVGAWVWVFFENGNILYPKYFGAVQAGDNYFSEHTNQHCFATDNVSVIIDEAPMDPRSTKGCDSNNSDCTTTVKMCKEMLQREKMPTMVTITVNNVPPESSELDPTQFCGINLVINGNTNIKLNGNVYEEINGDKFVTHKGNLYYKHEGDIEYQHKGLTQIAHEGERLFSVSEDNTELTGGNYTQLTFGDKEINNCGNKSEFTAKSDTRTSMQVIQDYCQLIKHN